VGKHQADPTAEGIPVCKLCALEATYAQTLLTLHGEFVQSQMEALTEQARVLGEISSKATMDTAKPKS
jgi:hypothetical protein